MALSYIIIKLYIHLFDYENFLMITVLILNNQINCNIMRRHVVYSFNVILTHLLE